jgi:hypothetical protein
MVEAGLATMRKLAASVPEPGMAFRRLMQEANWAFVTGRLEASERLALEMFEAGRASREPDAALVFGVLLFRTRYFQGRLAEMVEASVRLADAQDGRLAWRASATLALAETGHEDQARERALTENLQRVPLGPFWLIAMFLRAHACSRLRLPEHASEVYELLRPFPGQLVTGGPVVYGSIDATLGVLATTVERYKEADEHFAAAARIEDRFGAPLFLARTHAGWARALIARGRPEDVDRAPHLLEQAEEIAAPIGAGLVTREVAESRAELAAVSS